MSDVKRELAKWQMECHSLKRLADNAFMLFKDAEKKNPGDPNVKVLRAHSNRLYTRLRVARSEVQRYNDILRSDG